MLGMLMMERNIHNQITRNAYQHHLPMPRNDALRISSRSIKQNKDKIETAAEIGFQYSRNNKLYIDNLDDIDDQHHDDDHEDDGYNDNDHEDKDYEDNDDDDDYHRD
ncbi:uncharacterized protein [Cherax quadricarinatus]|uniref:uncharacterized protein n=1 Tax=Cherax quadricarinatus TaxID=27406 RepID=UPI00387EE296